MTTTYNTGDTIIYQTFTGQPRKVVVTLKDENIKDGRAGFDATIVGGPDAGMTVWGYDDQIIRVCI